MDKKKIKLLPRNQYFANFFLKVTLNSLYYALNYIYVFEVTYVDMASWLFIESVLFPRHCIRIYPIALMCAKFIASFPHVFESSCHPPVPNPILESH